MAERPGEPANAEEYPAEIEEDELPIFRERS